MISWKFILWSNWISFPLPLDWLPLHIFPSLHSLSTVKMALNWIRIILQKISSISIRCAPFNLAVICLVYMLMSLMHFEFSLTPHIEPILKKYLSFQIWTNCELLSKRKFNSIYQLWLFNVNFTFSLKSILLPRNCNALMHFSTNFCIIFRSNIFTSLLLFVGKYAVSIKLLQFAYVIYRVKCSSTENKSIFLQFW